MLRRFLFMAVLLCVAAPLWAQQRYVVVDQDGVGPGGSDVQSILLLLQSHEVNLLGITVVSGDVWADAGARHILRALELVGHPEVPVYTGASVPLIRTAAEAKIRRDLYGKGWYEGAFGIDPKAQEGLKEGEPTTHLTGTDAVHFLISTVHQYPHQVTIFAGGPMTNIALAIRADPHFSELAKELVLMGGSMNPKTADPEFSFNPRHEFNFWFDPEAAHIVLTAPWARITETTVDISLQAQLTEAAKEKLAHFNTASARYMARYGTDSPYLWDELAVLSWLDPKMIRTEETLYVDANVDHGYSYGDTITWSEQSRPAGLSLQKVHVQEELDYPLFEAKYLGLLSATSR